MTDGISDSVLAIDGGGTRCRMAIKNGSGITSVETGSANATSDFDGTVAQILEGLKELARRSGHSAEHLANLPAFIGLAGAVDRSVISRLHAALPFTNAHITDDRATALRGALATQDGVLAHCGTGSFFGIQTGGHTRFSGGWGPILGDEASAQWIGKRALSNTLRAVDGRAKMTDLAHKLVERFDGASGIVRFAATARPTDFGAMAPMVTDHAGRKDALAVQILTDGAMKISENIRAIGWNSEHAICLTGGIGPFFADYLPTDLQRNLTKPNGDPLSGAILLAQEWAISQS